MSSRPALTLDSAQRERIGGLFQRCRRMHEDPEGSLPMIIVDVTHPAPRGTGEVDLPTWEERLADPLVMMNAQLEEMRSHVELEDDCIPTLRVEFGTGQVAAAFGCQIVYPANSYPAVGTHSLENADDVYDMPLPSLHAGMYPRLEKFTRVFLENMPDGMRIQPPDLQSPFNCSHLIRGNDIFTDFIDNPAAVDALLDKVTDYLVELVPHLRRMINCEDGWFLDYGALWRGGARISNCSMQMISPDFYRRHVLPRDTRLFRSIGGGRVHYCGLTKDVVPDFAEIPGCTGLDLLSGLKWDDVWESVRGAQRSIVVLKNVDRGTPELQRLLGGDWPARRNIIIKTGVLSLEEGRETLARLRESAARAYGKSAPGSPDSSRSHGKGGRS